MSDLHGFKASRIDCGEVTLAAHRAGRGEALVLLHGFPQNHRCWARVAPTLAEHFHVIVPDLRGYGDSDAPPGDPAHLAYSKRRMAGDVVALLDRLGLERAHVLGHDRGARVAYRLSLDHPGRVNRLGIIEVLPTYDYWHRFDAALGMAIWHWTFLAQPAPLPEAMINAAPQAFVDAILERWTKAKSLAVFAPEGLASYRAQMGDPARVAAMCADYRAGATSDTAHDRADLESGHKITAPLHFLYADGGFPARAAAGQDPAQFWRAWASDVSSGACESGHFAMEENPSAVLAAFLPHFLAR
jgi:haloacetate dehalogenase